MAKITFTGGGAYMCGTVVSAPNDVEIIATDFNIVSCRKGFDISDKAETRSQPDNDADKKWHAKPSGILALGVATMLSGTAISRLMGL